MQCTQGWNTSNRSRIDQFDFLYTKDDRERMIVQNDSLYLASVSYSKALTGMGDSVD